MDHQQSLSTNFASVVLIDQQFVLKTKIAYCQLRIDDSDHVNI